MAEKELIRTRNLSERLTVIAREYPDKKAVVCHTGTDSKGQPIYSSMTFKELEEEANRYAHGLSEIGIKKDMRTIFLVRPSVAFFALTFALVRIGVVLVLIDPGMGTKKLVSSLSSINAEAFVGIPKAHLLRILSPGAFKSLKIKVTVGKKWFWGGKSLSDVRSEKTEPYEPGAKGPRDKVGIFFTSGSTGPPKGVVYEHSMFDAQLNFLNDHFGYGPDDVDLATFPLFSLFDAGLGITSVIPDMDATKPGEADPGNIVRAIKDNGCTSVYGSPALLNNLARYGEEKGIKLDTVKKIVTAGAPIRPELLQRLHKLLPKDARIHTPYGATEALPVSDVTSALILNYSLKKTARGAGTCVGNAIPGNQVRIIEIIEDPIEDWGHARILPDGEIGEICVKGPTVTREYYQRKEATKKAKIPDPDGGFWHRMGDTGYIDEKGYLWFCGRKAHRVVTEKGTLFTVRSEAIFNQHPKVFRSSLVGIGKQGSKKPVIIIELEKEHRKTDREKLKKELLSLAKKNPLTEEIEDLLFQDAFPVDIRHNAKIFREKQSVWAAKELGGVR
jgi:acyl-CoA synthetase (AMP-forming)/AMP-acid ligase II